MIRVGLLRKIFFQCNFDWKIVLQKWEHIKDEELNERSYPLPNLISVKVKEIQSRYNDLGGKIYTVICEDDFDNDFMLSRTDMIKFFCGDKNDEDLIEFALRTEDTPGHYNYIKLNVTTGDKGYSDKILHINLEEDKE